MAANQTAASSTKILFSLLAIVIGVGISLVFIELGLRVYNPVPMPLRGLEIVLPVNALPRKPSPAPLTNPTSCWS